MKPSAPEGERGGSCSQETFHFHHSLADNRRTEILSNVDQALELPSTVHTVHIVHKDLFIESSQEPQEKDTLIIPISAEETEA